VLNLGNGKKLIQSVVRALKILEYIAEKSNNKNDNLVGVTDVSEGLGLSKSTVHGLITTLEQMGYIHQDKFTSKYSLGIKLFELGQNFFDNMDLCKIAYPFISELSEKTGETVHLATLVEGEVLYLDKIDSPHAIGMLSKIGRRNYAHCTGVGKVLLSELSDNELNDIIDKKGLLKYTENTITNKKQLKEHLKQVQEQGYSFDLEEIEYGLHCIAAPIRDIRGNVIAAISISGPKTRLPIEKLKNSIDDIKDSSRKISYNLGYKK
jgi:DNA-binding IclR family transcriptional regulator